jgi:hypothetical protein
MHVSTWRSQRRLNYFVMIELNKRVIYLCISALGDGILYPLNLFFSQ